MKFKVSSKDFMIFGIFCIVLLYLCAIGVLNFASFGQNGEFHGLNPFPAFGPDFIGATIILFIIILVVIFSSVSSYIFSKDKGSGLGLSFGEKNEKGYSRWANEKEIKEDKDVEKINPLESHTDAAGVPLINNGKEIWVDNGEYHNLVIGATGSGKTETVVKPMVNILAKKGESMIIMDPKGEIYKYSAEYLKSRDYKIIVLNFRDPEYGNAWNPLTLPYRFMKDGNSDKATELLEDVALNIVHDPDSKDQFWPKSAADYFSGLALGLFEDAKEEEVNLNSISFMSSVGEEKFAASNYIKEYFSLKGENTSPYIFASNTINAPAETKGGILSVFRQKIRQFATREHLSEMLAYSDFDLRDIGKEKTSIFIIIHDEKTTYHSLATIFIKQCYESLVEEAQKNGGKLPYRTNFILDEFANMPPLKDVDAMVTAARSRDIRFTFIIQNFGQLKDIYGEKAGTIKGNCGNTIYLISTELSSLEEISKLAGEVKSSDKDKTASTPLVTVTDLQKLSLFEAIIFRWRKPPFKTKYTPDYKMEWGINRVLAEHIHRESKEVKMFDVKTYVKEEKRKKLFDSLENPPKNDSLTNDFSPMPGAMPQMPGATPNPFGNMNTGMPPNPLFGGGMPANFDIDAMIKSIDEKIAELDAEEERKKKELEEKNKATDSTSKDIDINEKKDTTENSSVVDDNSKNIDKVIKDIKTKVEEKEISSEVNKVEKPEFKAEVVQSSSRSKTTKMKSVFETEPDNEEKKEEVKVEKKKATHKTIKVIERPIVNVDVDSVIVNDNVISDDEFFDDFFGDD